MNLQEPNGDRSSQTTLESWKEIAAYLQRDAKTASRWEKEEGLPVHRHSHKARSSVYAYPSEIDAWRVSRKATAEAPAPVPVPRSVFLTPRALAFGTTMLACLIMVGNGIRPASAQAARAGTLAKRLLCTGCADSEANFSPDGRLMVFTDWDSGDIAIRNMSTGKVKRLLAKPGNWKDGPDTYADTPVFSPDLRQIVYVWDLGYKQRGQLRVMANEPGAKPRVLVDNPEYNWYDSPAWSPDGKSVLVMIESPGRTSQLARVSVSDGAVKVLKSLEWRRANIFRPVSLSPDGQYSVYSALAVNPSTFPPAATDPKDQHIYILAADGSSETEMVRTAGLNQSPIWTPDGKHILFISDRSGKFDLWSVAMQNGKAAGAATLVRPDIGNVYAAGTHVGSYYYWTRETGTEYVNIAEFTPGAGKESRIARPTESFVGIHAAWSPDGKSIAFKRHHPGTENWFDSVVHSLETGEERTYLTKLGATGGAGPPVWFHDGKAIMTRYSPTDGGGPAFSYRIELNSGEFKVVPGEPGAIALSPDDQNLYLARRDHPNTIPDRILSLDLASGAEKEIFRMPEPGYTNLLLTPDGRTFVTERQDEKTRTCRFHRLNLDGTGYREIYTIARKDFQFNFTLTRDGRSILLAKQNEEKNWELIRIPIEGGEPESTGVALDSTLYHNSIDLSPDGSRIAFTTSKRVEELWTLDNVLAALK